MNAGHDDEELRGPAPAHRGDFYDSVCKQAESLALSSPVSSSVQPALHLFSFLPSSTSTSSQSSGEQATPSCRAQQALEAAPALLSPKHPAAPRVQPRAACGAAAAQASHQRHAAGRALAPRLSRVNSSSTGTSAVPAQPASVVTGQKRERATPTCSANEGAAFDDFAGGLDSPQPSCGSWSSVVQHLASCYYEEYGAVPDVPAHIDDVRQRAKRQKVFADPAPLAPPVAIALLAAD